MSQKKETIVLLSALLLTLGLVGAGVWWFRNNFGTQFYLQSQDNHVDGKINHKSIYRAHQFWGKNSHSRRTFSQ